jgi:starvation-inducible outer membrane lipoprotein
MQNTRPRSLSLWTAGTLLLAACSNPPPPTEDSNVDASSDVISDMNVTIDR